MRSFAGTVCISLLLGAAFYSATAEPAFEETVLPQARGSDRIGVDASGHLWSWTREGAEARAYIPDGRVFSVLLPDALDLDVDHRYGVVTLDPNERRLGVWHWDGQRTHSVELPFRVRGLAWLDAETVLVAPSDRGVVLGVLDLRTGSIVRTMGAVPELETGPGAIFLRTTKLEPDSRHGVIHALESLRGGYWKFELDSGKVLEQGQQENPNRLQFQHWLESVHEGALREGRAQRLGVEWFRLGLDASGQAWTLRECLDTEQGSVASMIRLGSNPEVREIDVPCCSLNMTILEQHVLMSGVRNQERCDLLVGLPGSSP